MKIRVLQGRFCPNARLDVRTCLWTGDIVTLGLTLTDTEKLGYLAKKEQTLSWAPVGGEGLAPPPGVPHEPAPPGSEVSVADCDPRVVSHATQHNGRDEGWDHNGWWVHLPIQIHNVLVFGHFGLKILESF